jgi:hypothetical protein
MEKEYIKWLADILEESHWLFYGEFEVYLNEFLKQIFQKEFNEIGYNEKLPNDFQVAYWSVISEMEFLYLFEYGTSPRGGWLTEKGKKFKEIIMNNENALSEAQEYIMNKNN